MAAHDVRAQPPCPAISVVVGVTTSSARVDRLLDALASQDGAGDVEVILVSTVSLSVSTRWLERLSSRHAFRDLQVVQAPLTMLTPELWRIGLERARGIIVAFTTSEMIPTATWLRAIQREHEGPWVGVGGTIACDPQSGIMGWATYLARYHAFMPANRRRLVPHIAGDNATYKRWALEAVRPTWQHGFWEAEVHSELVARGFELALEPALLVEYHCQHRAGQFVVQRFRHGLRYGLSRGASLSFGTAFLRTLLAPGIPALLLARIWRNARAAGEASRVLLAAPLLLLFLASWASGEMAGYARRLFSRRSG
ncbi:MAG TPA: glycosyltransferase family A protein [Gemmatimonadaceae bacterium]|nr:glycosyltransferase family A protein [Gemmatimonadaceae bacterium]